MLIINITIRSIMFAASVSTRKFLSSKGHIKIYHPAKQCTLSVTLKLSQQKYLTAITLRYFT